MKDKAKVAPFVFLNGKFLPEKMAKISVFDHGFLYGDGVYETLRTYDGQIWQMNEHLQRLQNSAKLLGLKLPWSLARVGQWVKKTVLLNKFKESRIRITLTRGINNFDFLSCKKPILCIQVKRLVPGPKSVYGRGVHVVTMRQGRVLPEAKSISLLPMILGQQIALKHGAYETIFIDPEGFVREGTVTNIFMVKHGIVMTPKTKVLDGVTATILLRIIKKIHGSREISGVKYNAAGKLRPFSVQKKDFKINYLRQADEVFLTNAVRGIVPVVKIDKHTIGRGLPGSVTKKLAKAFYDYVQEKTPGHGYFKRNA